MNKIKFSFIIPTLNEEKYIENCLKSIKNQKGNYEIIVVDSYSRDRTISIAKKFGCKILFEKRKGPAIARNIGAKHAKGDIIIFVDADARFDRDFLEKLDKKFEKNIGGCIFKQGIFDTKDNYILFLLKLWNAIISSINKIGFAMTNGVCFAYRKKYFNSVGGFDPKLLTNEDHDLARRIKKISRFVFFNDIVVYTSLRRAKKLGFKKFITLQLKATLFYFLKHKSLSEYWC
ncbi:MAG: glycosyltransferase [Candidatus Aenigmatarchaeota archaeon]